MLTALATDDRTLAHRRAVARFAQETWHQTPASDRLDQWADLVHAAEAAARRTALAG